MTERDPPTPPAPPAPAPAPAPAASLPEGRVEESPAVPRWAVHRRLYDWVLSFAHHRHSTSALFLLSFAESSFFPIPPDVLLVALALERRAKAWYYAAVCTLASVVGGVLGYAIGWGVWHAVDAFFFRFVFSPEVFEQVQGIYQKWDFWAIFAAAFTPIPYKVFTIAAGVFEISLVMFIVASVIGRGARFFLVAGLIWKFGPPIRTFIERYFNAVCVAATLLLIGGFVALKLLR